MSKQVFDSKVSQNQTLLLGIKNLQKILLSIQAPTIAIIISILNSLFFVAVGLRDIPFVSRVGQRSIGLVILACIFTLTFLVAYYSPWDKLRKWSVWLRSNLLTFFSFAYFVGINAVNITVFGFTFNTGFAGAILAVLIFLVNLNLFGQNRTPMYLLVPQIILFCLQTFSFINLLEKDKTVLRDFTTDWIDYIFSFGDSLWLVICALSVAVVSVFSFRLKSTRESVIFILVVGILSLQSLFAIDNVFGLSYWFKALLFLVFWDYLYNPLLVLTTRAKDSNFRIKLIISTIYHLLLMLVIIAGRPVFG
ncbi:MAG: hypothetical protein AAGF07_04770 [Patescibacteria group bacterium]